MYTRETLSFARTINVFYLDFNIHTITKKARAIADDRREEKDEYGNERKDRKNFKIKIMKTRRKGK